MLEKSCWWRWAAQCKPQFLGSAEVEPLSPPPVYLPAGSPCIVMRYKVTDWRVALLPLCIYSYTAPECITRVGCSRVTVGKSCENVVASSVGTVTVWLLFLACSRHFQNLLDPSRTLQTALRLCVSNPRAGQRIYILNLPLGYCERSTSLPQLIPGG